MGGSLGTINTQLFMSMQNEPQEYECYNCETSYQILAEESDLDASFCPYCGAEIDADEEYDEEDPEFDQ